MSLDNPGVVDALGVDHSTLRPVLTLADSWDWSCEHEHLLALQAKLNKYFEFVESGQILEICPGATNRQVIIDIVTRFPLPIAAQEFLKKAEMVAAQFDVLLHHRHFHGDQNNDTVQTG